MNNKVSTQIVFQFIIAGFVSLTPNQFSVSSSTLLMSLPSFGQAAIQQRHMEGCVFNRLCFICAYLCAHAYVCVILTLTQLPRLRCLSSMQKVRIVRIAVCCRDNKEKDKERKMPSCHFITRIIYIYLKKKSYPFQFVSLVISYSLKAGHHKKKSGNNGGQHTEKGKKENSL